MAIVTVADLCRLLPGQLRSVAPAVPPDNAISGVHVSELPDPTVGLGGGELLLTIGQSLPPGRQDCREYIDRLCRAGAAALGVGGLGAPRTPPRLVEACRTAGLPLLEVRPRTPFLVIGNTYWQLASADDRRQLSSALTAQSDLVMAAASEAGFSVLLNVLADALDGWAALFDRQGTVVAASQPLPDGVQDDLHEHLCRLQGAGNRASATLSAAGQEIIVHALPCPSPILGCLAVGVERRITADDRRTILTCASLLTLQVVRRTHAATAGAAESSPVAYLVDIGELSAARQLAAWRGRPLPTSAVRVLVLDGLAGRSAVGVVAAAWPDHDVIGIDEPNGGWCWLAGADVDRQELLAALPDPGRSRAIVGPPVELGHVGSQRRWLQVELQRQQPGSVVDASLGTGTRDLVRAPEAQALLAPLLGTDQRHNVAAFAAFLRHQGHWESAARELSIHRNTLRYRVAKAAELVDADITDADQRARFWLCLRTLGLA